MIELKLNQLFKKIYSAIKINYKKTLQFNILLINLQII